MKTDDQKDEYAQRVNHEKEDRAAERTPPTPDHAPLVERLKERVARDEEFRANVQMYEPTPSERLMIEAIYALELSARVNAGHIALIESQAAALTAPSVPVGDGALLREAADRIAFYVDCVSGDTLEGQVSMGIVNRIRALSTPAPSGCPSQGETPRTDAFCNEPTRNEGPNLSPNECRLIGWERFARQLERALNAANKECDEICAALDCSRAHDEWHPAHLAADMVAQLATPQPSPSPAGGADGERLMKFAGIILDQHYNDGEIGDVDGFFIQEQATECGLLEVVTRNEPCGEGCACADAGDFPTQCFIRSKLGEACIHAATQATPAKDSK